MSRDQLNLGLSGKACVRIDVKKLLRRRCVAACGNHLGYGAPPPPWRMATHAGLQHSRKPAVRLPLISRIPAAQRQRKIATRLGAGLVCFRADHRPTLPLLYGGLILPPLRDRKSLFTRQAQAVPAPTPKTNPVATPAEGNNGKALASGRNGHRGADPTDMTYRCPRNSPLPHRRNNPGQIIGHRGKWKPSASII